MEKNSCSIRSRCIGKIFHHRATRMEHSFMRVTRAERQLPSPRHALVKNPGNPPFFQLNLSHQAPQPPLYSGIWVLSTQNILYFREYEKGTHLLVSVDFRIKFSRFSALFFALRAGRHADFSPSSPPPNILLTVLPNTAFGQAEGCCRRTERSQRSLVRPAGIVRISLA